MEQYELYQQTQLEKIPQLTAEFRNFLNRHRESFPVLVYTAEQLVDWRLTKDVEFRDMFCTHSKALNPTFELLPSIYSFLLNTCVNQESAFQIRWLTVDEDAACNLILVHSTRENPKTMPYVYWTDEGEHDPRLILDAMEERLRRRERQWAMIANR
ncbi:MAG: hypothetical protein E6R04_11395 [Spirochaetes bacterium]|nr:MAG: hypothetical protein E6R04_11395 [Spirochaetota bacterium]